MKNLFSVFIGILLSWICISVQAAYITDKLVAGLYSEAKVTDKPVKALNSGTPLEVISRENEFVQVRTSDGTVGWVEAAYLTDEKPARSILLDTQAKVSMLQKQLEQVKGLAENASANGGVADLAQWQEKLTKAQGQISQLEIQLKAAKLNNQKWQESQQSLDGEKQQLIAQMKAESEAAMVSLQQQNEALKEQIRQVAEILNISPEAISAETPAVAATTQMKIVEILSHDWIWVLLVVALILGFAGGFYFMRYKVIQRFGKVMRL